MSEGPTPGRAGGEGGPLGRPPGEGAPPQHPHDGLPPAAGTGDARDPGVDGDADRGQDAPGGMIGEGDDGRDV